MIRAQYSWSRRPKKWLLGGGSHRSATIMEYWNVGIMRSAGMLELIIADYLKRHGHKGKVRRVVSIGTPFQGAVDAVLKLIIGKGHLSGENPRDRERVAARTVPALSNWLERRFK